MFEWFRKLFSRSRAALHLTEKASGPEEKLWVTIKCRNCGKTFVLPENVQHWPDYCQECRAKAPAEMITRKCRKCGREFSFSSSLSRWPKNCPECRHSGDLLRRNSGQAGNNTRCRKKP